METRVHIDLYGDVTAHARHSTPPSQFSTAQYSTTQLWPSVALCDINQTRSKRGVIEEVNQTVKSAFEPSLLMHLSPVHA